MAAPLQAAELQVYPLRLAFDTKTPTALLTVTNRGSSDALLQVSLFAWQQADGDDKLAPTRDVLVNPPVFQLRTGAEQIVRFGLRVPQGDVERTYRLMLQEVPLTNQTGPNGLTTLLKMSIPIFVPPARPVVAMAWRVVALPNGRTELVMHNGGNVHVQVRQLRMTVNGKPAYDKPINVYVLPGATRAIPVQTDVAVTPGAAIGLQADTDQSPLSVSVPAEAAGNGSQPH